ncbi:MAG TPA: hypothetical protein GX530_05880 [Corynebacteriales bacterium]|nr:hypothetical protein [Mycobacteriales bacterium]
MGLFSLILLLVPFVIGGVLLLLERFETRLDAANEKDAQQVAAAAASMAGKPAAGVDSDDATSTPPEAASE